MPPRPPFYPPPNVDVRELHAPPAPAAAVADAPHGIPPELWALQSVDNIADTNGTGTDYPGYRMIKLDLPARYARPWRVLLSPVVTQAGVDPFLATLANPSQQDAAAHDMYQPTVFPPVLPTSPVVGSNARLTWVLGNDRNIVSDYPVRGGVYSFASSKLELFVYEEQYLAGAPIPTRYRAVLQPGIVGQSWDRPTRTIRHPNVDVPGPGSTYLQTSIPYRAVACRLMPNPVSTEGIAPCRVRWMDAAGNVIESFTLSGMSSNDAPTWVWAGNPGFPWPVPPLACFLSVERFGGSSVWTNPKVVFQLAL